MAEEKKKPYSWHQAFAENLQMVLTPVGIDVMPEVEVISKPPRADLILIRREEPEWTEEQRARLCEGIRDCRAPRVFLEQKHTESVNSRVIRRAIANDVHLKDSLGLEEGDLASYIVTSKTPDSYTLRDHGYQLTDKPGVYRSNQQSASYVDMIILNELENTPYNVAFKLFASRMKEQYAVLQLLNSGEIPWAEESWYWFAKGICKVSLEAEESIMQKVSQEFLREIGRSFTSLGVMDLVTDHLKESNELTNLLANNETFIQAFVRQMTPEQKTAFLQMLSREQGQA
ncbi:MAG: hypothetical protein QNK37_27745 [Acidobacteriota bacterium]|nr:hypothetical protein [Acidobacteriota bacterium]